jgi:hypothetical protein
MCEYCGEEWDLCGVCGGCPYCEDCFCHEDDDETNIDDAFICRECDLDRAL